MGPDQESKKLGSDWSRSGSMTKSFGSGGSCSGFGTQGFGTDGSGSWTQYYGSDGSGSWSGFSNPDSYWKHIKNGASSLNTMLNISIYMVYNIIIYIMTKRGISQNCAKKCSKELKSIIEI